MNVSSTASYVANIPVLDEFSAALPLDQYVAVPDNWLVAVSDVVKSRKAISEGRFKAVNMAGVAMISAIMNGLGHQQVPYAFGGDGAAMAFAPEDRDVVADALSRTVGWVADDLHLELRAAIVPVSVIREKGDDVKVAAVRISPVLNNYAFLGGGIATAEKLMKDGQFGIERAGAGERPDLTGLSCRWTPISAQGRKIVSLIVEPGAADMEITEKAMADFLELIESDSQPVNPMPTDGPGFKWPPEGLALESRASGMGRGILYLITLLAWFFDKTGLPLGKFDPVHYRKVTGLNTDYRKIQDGLRMTVSLDDDQFARVKEFLQESRESKALRYGLSVQDSALLTCFVPSITEDNHFHFLDGGGGGYAAAASDMDQ